MVEYSLPIVGVVNAVGLILTISVALVVLGVLNTIAPGLVPWLLSQLWSLAAKGLSSLRGIKTSTSTAIAAPSAAKASDFPPFAAVYDVIGWNVMHGDEASLQASLSVCTHLQKQMQAVAKVGAAVLVACLVGCSSGEREYDYSKNHSTGCQPLTPAERQEVYADEPSLRQKEPELFIGPQD